MTASVMATDKGLRKSSVGDSYIVQGHPSMEADGHTQAIV